MKYIFSFFVLFSFIFIYSGCDSATDSKSVSVSPPSLVSPYDNDSNVATHTAFTWTGEADILWIDVSPAFNSPITYTVSGTSYTLTTPLNVNSLYYWKAGKTVSSNVYWSNNVYRFRTGAN